MPFNLPLLANKLIDYLLTRVKGKSALHRSQFWIYVSSTTGLIGRMLFCGDCVLVRVESLISKLTAHVGSVAS
jgi:hypothetical protein